MQTFYFLYKITNIVNNKIYLGKHKTKNLDDGYFGSGKLLKRAISKYGRENFTLEILEQFNSEEELNQAEKELITEEFCQRKDNYNLCVGGKGGFSYINRTISTKERSERGRRGGYTSKPNKEKCSETLKHLHREGKMKRSAFNDKRRDTLEMKYGVRNASLIPEVIKKRKETYKEICHAQGERNSQYGSMWITNGNESIKIKRCEQIPEGWYKGRRIRKHSIPTSYGIVADGLH